MIINESNCHVGNKAMASALLLYYHLVEEGGFTYDQTVYINHDDFNGFDFLSVHIEAAAFSLDLNKDLIQQGAVIYLLCDLKDLVDEYDADFLLQPATVKIVTALNQVPKVEMPELSAVINQVNLGPDGLDYTAFGQALQVIYQNMFWAFFQVL